MKALTNPPSLVLVVDPDPITLTATAAVLNMSGHECYCAQDGEAARKAIRGLDLDLIVSDIDGHVQDGLEMCREWKQDAGAAAIPIILIAGDDSSNLIRLVHDAGATYFLRKPFDPDVLIDLVEGALWMPHLVHQHTRLAGEIAADQSASRPASPPVPPLRRPRAIPRNRETT